MASNSLATNYSALSTATTVTAVTFLNAGDNTIITGTTAGQYVFYLLNLVTEPLIQYVIIQLNNGRSEYNLQMS